MSVQQTETASGVAEVVCRRWLLPLDRKVIGETVVLRLFIGVQR